MAKKDKVVGDYKVTAVWFGKKFVSTGSSVKEAILGLDLRNCKGKIVLIIEHGDNKKERILMPRAYFGLFSGSPMMREIALKNVGLLFDL